MAFIKYLGQMCVTTVTTGQVSCSSWTPIPAEGYDFAVVVPPLFMATATAGISWEQAATSTGATGAGNVFKVVHSVGSLTQTGTSTSLFVNEIGGPDVSSGCVIPINYAFTGMPYVRARYRFTATVNTGSTIYIYGRIGPT
jgi:hypothetical protein